MYDWSHIDLLLSIEAKIRSYPKLKHIHTAVMQELEAQKPVEDDPDPIPGRRAL